MATEQYLAIDLGAESGRGALAGFDGERLTLRELGRFPTGRGQEDIGADGVRRWDFERIWGEIDRLVRQAEGGGALAGIGVDSWGVDFGLLDAAGNLLEPPVAYRDASHPPAREAAFQVVPEEELWDRTGIKSLPFNTLFQLAAIHKRDPALLDNAQRLLMISDLVHHRLTGGSADAIEATNASTTQMLNPRTKTWEKNILEKLGIPSNYLGALVEPGTRIGQTAQGTPVYAPATHDTASAVVAVPAEPTGNWAYLSSGTWSLLGVEEAAPRFDADLRRQGFSNEGGVGGTTRLLKNIIGLWLVQECRRSLIQTDREYSYAELTALASSAPAGGSTIDASDPRFLAPRDMAAEIRTACRDAGQPAPETPGALTRCCLESLALAYRRDLAALETSLGRKFDRLHIVGGGSQNRVLNQWTADACGIPVIAGPSEATALGNVLGQMVGAGRIANWQEARQICRQSASPELFTPNTDAKARWEE